MLRRGFRASSPRGAAASKPMKASRQKIIPWNAGWTPPSPGMNTLAVLRDPALMISSSEMNTKIAISMRPSTTPARVEIWIPVATSHHSRTPQSTARTTHRYWKPSPTCR